MKVKWYLSNTAVDTHSDKWLRVITTKPMGDTLQYAEDFGDVIMGWDEDDEYAPSDEHAAAILNAVNSHDGLVAALEDARTHLEYCGYGDKWERECAEEYGLAKKIDDALTHAKKGEPDEKQTS